MGTGKPWLHADYVAHIQKFLAAHPELTMTDFGLLAAGDPAMLGRLYSGKRRMGPASAENVTRFIDTYKFADAFAELEAIKVKRKAKRDAKKLAELIS